jgi:sugar phosphate isomerase/epimerase
MDRRTFVGTLGAAGAAAVLPGGGSLLASEKLGKIGVQLYTVRDLMKASVEKTLAEVAAIGYEEVEFAGYFNRPPGAIRQLLDRNGLHAPAAHVGIELLRGPWNRTLDEAMEMGQKYLVVAWLDPKERSSVDAIKKTADLFNRAAEDAQRFKIQLAYHNHDFEFNDVEGRRMYDLFLENTDPKLVKMEMDLYWITKGGADPAAYFARWPERFPLVHVKDGGPPPDSVMTEVGKGVIKWGELFAQRKQAGIKHFFVEHDNPKDPMQSITTSYKYLRALRF